MRLSDLKQIQAGLAVTADGGIPVFARAYDGNAAEIAQVTDTMRALQTLAALHRFLLVGDSKLVSYTNVTAMNTEHVTFIAPLAASRVPDGLFTGLDPRQAAFVEYVAERDENTRFFDRGSYRVCEDTMDLTGPRKKTPCSPCGGSWCTPPPTPGPRPRPAHSGSPRPAPTWTPSPVPAGTRHHPTAEAVTAKATAIARRRRVVACLQTTVTIDDTGKPAFAWSFDQDTIDPETAADGWYALLTNLPADIGTTEVFLRYKDQPTVERRYSEFKAHSPR
ncbi:MAG: hypothetical protein QOH97_760 [Actinoplanes sp.]|jgi:hypothetical protein|nr:hypothetical protein [Actinoplanes sp.]